MGMGVDILVVQRKKLFCDKIFQGFMPVDVHDFLKGIEEKWEYQNRTEELEKDDSFKQLIPYVWIINPNENKVFLYKRATTGNEGRLYNKYSGGVGGHVDKIEERGDPITNAMMRELREEVNMYSYPSPKIVGFLNDDSEDVGKVHFGVVAIAETTEEVTPLEDMQHGKFFKVEDVEKVFSNPENKVEGWTSLSWPYVRNYLDKK
jgi:predicted NUDIX family phosphoesterase